MSSGRSSYNGIGLQDVTRPRSQPKRLKALLQDCESDDDDESEVKSLQSEDESDSNEPQPSLQDESAENIPLQETSPCKVSVNSSSKSDAKDIKDKFLSVTQISLEENRKIATDISSMQQRTNSAKENKEDRVLGDVKSERINFTLGETNKLEIHDRKREGKTQESLTTAARSYQSDAECPTDIALPSSSLSIYKGDYNTQFDKNRNLSSISSARSYHECAYVPDITNKREEHTYNVSSESKRPLAKNSESCLLNLSKEDRRHRGAQTSVERTSMDRKFPNVGLESAGCSNPQTTSGNLSRTAVKYNSQYNEHARYEANEKYATTDNTRAEFNTPSISDTAKSLSSMTRLVAETPLKHMQVMDTMHPNPCTSHKQLFRTPQSKLPSDSNKSHVQTPSTILSSWSQNNMRQTPMDGKNFIAKDCVQTPRNIVFTPTVGKGDPSRYIEIDAKNARRPLTDAVLTYSEPSAYPLESKPLLSQTRTETKCVTAESQQEDRSRKTIGLSEVKSMQTEGNYDNSSHLKLVNLLQETKEDKQPNMSNALLGSRTKDMHDKKENKLVMIGATTGTKIIQDFERKYKSEDNIVPNAESKCKKSYDPYTVPEKQAMPQREELRHIVDRLGNIQFSIPSTIPSQRQSKTLFVKDREYLILGSLGRGMSAEVLRVQDGSCGELRAIKCVDLSKMDKESAQGCLDEISLLRKLQAPCVVKMFDHHIKESLVYVVMEMGDTDLSRLLKSMSQEKRIPLTMILYYWTEMLTAVKHIHDNGVIHSDLKPGNFLLVRGRLKLIDFGIASNINSDMTSVLKSNPIGTLNYISPEALMDIGGSADSPTHNVKYKISFKSDVWSLGCILYSLVYGHTPFHHIRSQWVKLNAITNPKPNISFPTAALSGEGHSHERTPPILIDVMRKCLQHDPKARPTVSQLLQVQYVPNKQDAAPISAPNIPGNILLKIKHALNEEEWRQLLQILDKPT